MAVSTAGAAHKRNWGLRKLNGSFIRTHLLSCKLMSQNSFHVTFFCFARSQTMYQHITFLNKTTAALPFNFYAAANE